MAVATGLFAKGFIIAYLATLTIGFIVGKITDALLNKEDIK